MIAADGKVLSISFLYGNVEGKKTKQNSRQILKGITKKKGIERLWIMGKDGESGDKAQ
ncbi:MAG: hypothetical protein ACRC4V_01030 [Aeromonas veronii]